ncbi:MAG: hypothetical protein JWQ34_2142 [Mucilaginibacter sp.]|uniref:hypothetical protein n=1 Tax=Mucilaginibacter sp. TaxID=1882438 RepID=UPI0026132144|nr:hypothetical protein [Mucilaginibacter sp.]MDB5003917.1 hypothetical protein [Mucilaginibacter sp.]
MKRCIIFVLLILVISGCKKKRSTTDSTTTTTIPGKPSLTTPANNSICISGTTISLTESQVLFTWSTTVNTNSYDLVLKNLLTNTSTTTNATDTKATVTLTRNTPYSWYVSAKQNSSTTTTQSDIWKFYNSGAGTISYAPFPAEIVAPTYGQIIAAVNNKVDLSWKGSSVDNNITGYNVYFGTSTNPPVIINGITNTFLSSVAVAAHTTYYWRVITVDSNGNYTDSGLYQFNVQ